MEKHQIQEKGDGDRSSGKEGLDRKIFSQQHHNDFKSKTQDGQNDFCYRFGIHNLLGAVFHSANVVRVGQKLSVGW